MITKLYIKGIFSPASSFFKKILKTFSFTESHCFIPPTHTKGYCWDHHSWHILCHYKDDLQGKKWFSIINNRLLHLKNDLFYLRYINPLSSLLSSFTDCQEIQRQILEQSHQDLIVDILCFNFIHIHVDTQHTHTRYRERQLRDIYGYICDT